jgi:uncharacterized glyoxalase superfamily protein PhnB
VTTRYKPPGWHSITPRLVAPDAEALVDFLKQAFSATGEYRADGPSEMVIGDSVVMVSRMGPRETIRGFLYLYVEDADATYARAIAAGAQSLEAPCQTHYGDRRATVRDPMGNLWQIATRVEDV